MKKVFVIMLALVLAMSLIGCSANEAEQAEDTDMQAADGTDTQADDATDTEADAVSETNNPLAGKAVGENGEPYVLGYVLNETSSGWMSANMGYVKSLWERAGGEFLSFVSDYDMEKEISMMDDLKQMDPDAILVHPSDSHAIAPAVQTAMDEGYPVFAIDMGVIGADVNSYIYTDQVDMGHACGQYVVDNYSAEKPAVVLEIAGGLEQNGAQLRQQGFHNAVEGVEYVEIIQVIDTGWSSDVAFDGIQDAFERNPDINVIYSHSDFMMQGILEGLRVKGKLIPAGEEGHVAITSIDADPIGLQGIRDGYIDAIAENNPVLPAAIAINVILSEIYGQDYESEYVLDVPLVTAENVDSDDRWANLASGEFASWPVIEQDVYPVPSR